MRYFFVFLSCTACARTNPILYKDSGPCQGVASPRDLARVRDTQVKAYTQAGRDVRRLAIEVEKNMTEAFNLRNQSDRPLSVEVTLAAQARLKSVRDEMVQEAIRLEDLAVLLNEEDPSVDLPGGTAAEPRLTGIRDKCVEVVRETQTEISVSRAHLERSFTELHLIASEYQLPLKIEVRKATP